MPQQLKPEDLHQPVHKHLHRDFVTLHADLTVAHALARLRSLDISDRIVYLYVVDHENSLVGVIPVRRLLTAAPHLALSAIMIADVVSITVSDSVMHASELFLKHHLLALPVVDSANHLVGVIDISLFSDHVVSAAQQHQMDSIFQLIGVHLVLGRKTSPWTMFTHRFPWLLCNVSSGILCAFIAAFHEDLIAHFTILALFITAVLALAESVSVQSMTITIQSLLVHRLSWSRALLAVRKELITSLLLGLGASLLVAAAICLWRGLSFSALAIGLSVALSMVTACLLGVAVPSLIRALRVDPKIASGPIVLAVADVATLLFYFTIASWTLHS